MGDLFNDFTSFFNSLSWVANIIALITLLPIIYGIYNYIGKKMTPKYEYSDITSFILDKNNTSSPIKNKKIALVDDNPENYPLNFLKKSCFNISVFEEISLSNYDFLFDFDLIILDIAGIVKEDMKNGGLELIKRLKAKNKELLIIAASSKKFDPNLTTFFQLADLQINVPISEIDMEQIIEDILNEKFSLRHLAKEIDSFITGLNLSSKERSNIINYIINRIDKNINKEKYNLKMSKYSHKIDTYKLNSKISKLEKAIE